MSFRFHTSSHYLGIARIYGYHLWRQTAKSTDTIIPEMLSSRDVEGDVELMSALPVGSYPVIYKNTRLDIETQESQEFKGTGGSELKKWLDTWITIETETRSQAEKILDEFVSDAVKFTQKKESTKLSVQIYEVGYGWRYISNLHKRPIETVYLDPTEKEKLIADIRTFIAEENEYIEHGIPYKRCYMFQGIPGSGKTSLIFALASLLGKDISIFNFSAGVTDTIFISAISQLSNDRVLVLEDIDALFSHERRPTGSNRVSFSALLNVLDGVCRKDRMITFITTNYMKNLDPALLRPGRVDYILEFKFAMKNQIKQMFTKFLPRQEHNFEAFYELVENKKINMSLIQKFLFEHRKKPNILDYERELDKLVSAYEEKERTDII